MESSDMLRRGLGASAPRQCNVTRRRALRFASRRAHVAMKFDGRVLRSALEKEKKEAKTEFRLAEKAARSLCAE